MLTSKGSGFGCRLRYKADHGPKDALLTRMVVSESSSFTYRRSNLLSPRTNLRNSARSTATFDGVGESSGATVWSPISLPTGSSRCSADRLGAPPQGTGRHSVDVHLRIRRVHSSLPHKHPVDAVSTRAARPTSRVGATSRPVIWSSYERRGRILSFVRHRAQLLLDECRRHDKRQNETV